MSAIAGLVQLDARPAVERERIVSRMLDAMAQRGPDGRGENSLGPASFGHLLLHTTEESRRERLPMRAENLLLTAATRLDNRDSLFHLDPAPPALKCPLPPDSHLVLAAYAAHGSEFSARLEGDFAIALWNNADRSLHVARDHFGIKPVYYHFSPGRFLVFASQIRALFAHPEVPRRLNKTRLAQFWLGHLPNHEITFYDGIHRLPAGHTLTLALAKAAATPLIRGYYSLDPASEVRLGAEAEYEEAFRGHFNRAVRARLRTPFGVGFQLSGGLDSSAIACVARDQLREENRLPVRTYSDVFPTIPTSDERKYIDAVLAQPGFQPRFIEADRESSPLAELETFLAYDDEGNFNTNSNLVFALHRAMRADGVRVCLDGFDGDTTIGHGRFLLAELVQKGDWEKFDRELTSYCQLRRAYSSRVAKTYAGPALTQRLYDGHFGEYFRSLPIAAPHFQTSPLRLLLDTAVHPLAPLWLRRASRRLKNEPNATDFLLRLIDPSFARSIRLSAAARAFENNDTTHYLNERSLQHYLLTSGALAGALERYDYLAGHFQMENRHPFMDRRLIEFCLAIPSSQKMAHGYTRSILRRALAHTLPPEIAARPGKGDLTDAFRQGFTQRDRATLESWIYDARHLEGIVDRASLHDAYARLLEGKLPDLELFVLFRVLTSGAWLRRNAPSIR